MRSNFNTLLGFRFSHNLPNSCCGYPFLVGYDSCPRGMPLILKCLSAADNPGVPLGMAIDLLESTPPAKFRLALTDLPPMLFGVKTGLGAFFRGWLVLLRIEGKGMVKPII